jgi:diguanylate cyclase (GGDEF)-like protein/PAS domain S-box-containing protein
MRLNKLLRVGPIPRLSLGLVALLISLVMLSELVFGVLPGRDQQLRQTRQRVAENLALQITPLLEVGDTSTLGKTIQQVMARDADIRAITVRRVDGSVYMQRGGAASASATSDTAVLAASPASTLDELRVGIQSGRQAWGEFAIRFAPSQPTTAKGWLAQPLVQLVLILGVGGFVLVYAYLRRAMQYLNPSASVPDRVRKAFDSLAEGLVMVDPQMRIVLANRAFRQLHPDAESDLNGQALDALVWLWAGPGAVAMAGAMAEWAKTLRSDQPVVAKPLTLVQPTGAQVQLLVSVAAVADDKGRARGFLITFDNVTAVHQANEELRSTLVQLEDSRLRIEEQNVELRRLASRDVLTGCFNRRAFFEFAHALFDQAQQSRTTLCFLMVDIDHFKQFNDTYGHAVGDQVIQVVARALSAGLRQTDVLGRYGGEEFCIVLPGLSAADATVVAERMREDIEANAQAAVRGTAVSRITASFGMATLNMQARTVEAMIDQADQALYKSKQGGRNRVTQWQNAAALNAPVSPSGPLPSKASTNPLALVLATAQEGLAQRL